jgi:predicted CXXCH cytochrome family protein
VKLGRTFSAVLAMCLAAGGASAQVVPNRDVLGVHDLSAGTSPLRGPNANACIYCHVPHKSVTATPLWNQTLSTQPYTFYSSGTSQNVSVQPVIGKVSTLCLSCHDGTVGVGQTAAYGTLKMSGSIEAMGSKLEGSHPFSLQLPIKDAANLVASIAATHTTKDPTVKLIDGNVECSTCHDVHRQDTDPRSPNFLVRDASSGQLCLACHEVAARTVNSRDNSLSRWTSSVHSQSAINVAPKAGMGNYTTIAEYACSTCHVTHNATGPGLLRKNINRPANVDDTAQACFTCHDGSDNLVQPIRNVLADFQKIGHPNSDSTNPHILGEEIVLDRNRHATCADCHNSHAASPTVTFTGTPELRPSQTGVTGVAIDGSILKTAANQYENCLRCHGASANKQSLAKYGYMPTRALYVGDLLNVLLQFNTSATSTHPVMRDATNSSQPSLLNSQWDLSGKVQVRAMGTRILCTDCHNSDNNREFGGTGPNGPHGSRFDPVLERTYLMSMVSPGIFPAGGPGSSIVNLSPNPTLDPVTSPYALCAKCHDLTIINSNTSFPAHSNHMTAGISCSVCHSAHGVQAGTTGVSGRRLVTFDLNVVAPNKGVLSYGANGTCTLTCHMMNHEANGTVAPAN